ncbi:MAG: hypothetical protein DRP46_13625 [Candidatus Zixiibacteriota bacterium]|nr:MAG: hypothetical protein DRP46_13625 [candidate division Zixibacteria bacterium]
MGFIMKFRVIVFSLLAVIMAAGAVFSADKYSIDLSHSYAGFSVRHLVITNVKGNFASFSGEITFDENDTIKSSANVIIDIASINTSNADRDKHLRSTDFFDVEKYPEMTFVSTGVEKDGDDMILNGRLTMHGITKDISIPFELLGKVTDPWGKERIAFEGETKLSRKEYGMTWSKTIETGGLIVGDEIKIELQIEAVKK